MWRRRLGVAVFASVALCAGGARALADRIAERIAPPAAAPADVSPSAAFDASRAILVASGPPSDQAPVQPSRAAGLEASANARRAVTYMLWLLLAACISTVWIICGDDRRRRPPGER